MNSELFPSPPHSIQRLLFTPAAGYRDRVSGALVNVGTGGSYSAAASLSATNSRGSILWFTLHETSPLYAGYRANARTVRCVQASAREVCHSRCRRCRQRDAFHPKGPGIRGEPINRRFPLPPPKEAPGRPSAQTFKGNQHPNQGNIPNGAHTRIVRTQKTQIHGNPRNIHPPRTAWTPRTRRATGTPLRTEGTRAVWNSTKKRERSPARAMRKKPPLPPFVRLTSARRGYASPRREWRCRPT